MDIFNKDGHIDNWLGKIPHATGNSYLKTVLIAWSQASYKCNKLKEVDCTLSKVGKCQYAIPPTHPTSRSALGFMANAGPQRRGYSKLGVLLKLEEIFGTNPVNVQEIWITGRVISV